MEMVSEKAPLRYQRDEQTLREAARLIAACRAVVAVFKKEDR